MSDFSFSKNINADIAVNGTILLGGNVICDGFIHGRQISIFTHIHDDHLTGNYESALGFCNVYVSQGTKELLRVIRNETYGRTNLIAVDFGQKISYDDEDITLFPTKHILGSCQVLVECKDNRIVYSGDFDMPGTESIECDTLVLDATHGSKKYVKNSDGKDIIDMFLSTIKKALNNNKSVVIQGHHGHLQEIISKLSEDLDKWAFLAKKKIIDLALIYKKYDIQIKQEMVDINSKEGKEIISSGPCVYFAPLIEKGPMEDAEEEFENFLSRSCRIRISSDTSVWGEKPWYQINGFDKYSFNLSNHADFHGILEYVEKCRPKIVITDSFRSYYASNLAREIQKKLEIKTIALPLQRNIKNWK